MKLFLKFYRCFNYLSLDVVLGALLMLGLLSKSLQVPLPLFNYQMLAAAVWVIYAADHLLDVRLIKHLPFTGRYLFFPQPLLALAFDIIDGHGSIDLLLSNGTPGDFVYGVLLAAIGGLHYVLNGFEKKFRIYLGKEFRIAPIYAAGVSVSLWPRLTEQLWPSFTRILALLFFVTVLNLVLVADIEKSQDRSDQQISLPLFFSASHMRILLRILFVLNGALIAVAVLFERSLFRVWAVFLGMLLLHGILHKLRGPLSRTKVHRFFSEAIYFCPLLYLLF